MSGVRGRPNTIHWWRLWGQVVRPFQLTIKLPAVEAVMFALLGRGSMNPETTLPLAETRRLGGNSVPSCWTVQLSATRPCPHGRRPLYLVSASMRKPRKVSWSSSSHREKWVAR